MCEAYNTIWSKPECNKERRYQDIIKVFTAKKKALEEEKLQTSCFFTLSLSPEPFPCREDFCHRSFLRLCVGRFVPERGPVLLPRPFFVPDRHGPSLLAQCGMGFCSGECGPTLLPRFDYSSSAAFGRRSCLEAGHTLWHVLLSFSMERPTRSTDRCQARISRRRSMFHLGANTTITRSSPEGGRKGSKETGDFPS
jgi:hypothetical protein